METKRAIPDELVAALGGVPIPPRAALEVEDEKTQKKARRRTEKLRRDAERPPRAFERFRILIDVVEEGRKIVDLCDHKARYALVVIGVLNAGVFFLMSRAHLISGLPSDARPWLLGVLIAYAGLTFVFVFHAIDVLRPRQFHYEPPPSDEPVPGDPAALHRPLGILHWETVDRYDLKTYGRAWSGVRMEQLNAEAVALSYHLARLIRAKYAALGRLYWGLIVLVAIAALMLAGYTALAILND